MLGIPGNLDQFLNMHYLEKAGVAITLRNADLTAGRVAKAVSRLLEEPAFGISARQTANECARYAPQRYVPAIFSCVIKKPSGPEQRNRLKRNRSRRVASPILGRLREDKKCEPPHATVPKRDSLSESSYLIKMVSKFFTMLFEVLRHTKTNR